MLRREAWIVKRVRASLILGSALFALACGTEPDAAAEPEPPLDPEDFPTVPRLTFRTWSLGDASRVSDFAFVPGGEPGILEMLVLGHRGRVYHYRLDGDALQPLGQVEFAENYFENGCGLLSLTFDSDYEENGFVYFTRCLDAATNRLSRHVFQNGELDRMLETEAEILTITVSEYGDAWHRFGSIGFEPDGTLWALMGDGSTDLGNAQDTGTLAGKLLRIVPSRDPEVGGYEPAQNNAFSDPEDGLPEIYAFGLRSPWRGSRDRLGRFWFGDVGANRIEEVDLATEPGQNFGWETFEGPCTEDCGDLVDPITYYGRASDEPYDQEDEQTEPNTRRAVWVSEPYEAPISDRYYGLFDGKVLFGDLYAGWVRALEVDEQGELVTDEWVAHLPKVTGWKTGPDGFMYATDLDGYFYRALQDREAR